jgi:hypothetical protein
MPAELIIVEFILCIAVMLGDLRKDFFLVHGTGFRVAPMQVLLFCAW